MKASSKGIVKNLEAVPDEVLPFFEDTANLLIEKHNNNPKKALCAALAYLSGHYKNVMESRSLLTGQEKFVTFEMKFDHSFNSVSFVWSILRRVCPENVSNSIKGMRMYKDQTGVVFDVPDEHINRFEDIFLHMGEQRKQDFTLTRAKSLPELKEDAEFTQGQGSGYGGYGGRGGYGGGYGGQQSYGR